MGIARKMERSAMQRRKAEQRIASRPERRGEPARRAERNAAQAAAQAERTEWLASLTPEQRERYDRNQNARMERTMAICAPALALAIRSI